VFQSSGFNLIGTGDSVGAFNQPGDQPGIANPLLDSLADNGGPTMTHALLACSPAIDAGDPDFDPADPDDDPLTDDALPYDQRGAPFGRVFDGNSDSVTRIDIGAYESQPDGTLGDYNRDGGVNAADYVMWRKLFGTSVAPPFVGADGDGDSSIDPGDYDVWEENFGETLPGSGGASGELRAESGELRVEGEELREGVLVQASSSSSRAVPGGARRAMPVSERLAYIAARETGQVEWRERALVAWLDSRALEHSPQTVAVDGDFFQRDRDEATQEIISDDIDAVFESLSIGGI
jgi:hypothetical protein